MTFRCALAAALAILALPAAAAASDTTIAVTARATPLAAGSGGVLYSAWDGSAYRLTLLAGGTARTLPVPGQAQPFRADLGPGPDGHEWAVYPRCRAAGSGCDLYAYDLVAGSERKLASVDSPSDDEIAGAVWHDTLVFSRVYRSRHRAFIYRRPLDGARKSRRVSARTALSLDLRGTRVPFSRSLEWSNEPWLASSTGAPARRLASVPGSGAAVDFLTDVNPTAYGSSIYWLLTSAGDDNYSEIHRVDGLAFELAPPIRLR